MKFKTQNLANSSQHSLCSDGLIFIIVCASMMNNVYVIVSYLKMSLVQLSVNEYHQILLYQFFKGEKIIRHLNNSKLAVIAVV